MGIRQERTPGRFYATLGSLGQKIGIALSSALTGFLLQEAGFLSDNPAGQPDSALVMIRAMFGIMPGVGILLALIVRLFFDLEKKMPEVRASLDESGMREQNRQRPFLRELSGHVKRDYGKGVPAGNRSVCY